MIDVKSSMGRAQARIALTQVISYEPNLLSISVHCIEEMKKDGLVINDLLNVLKVGKIVRSPEQDFILGHWKYRVQTPKIAIVFRFAEYTVSNATVVGVKLITCWRI